MPPIDEKLDHQAAYRTPRWAKALAIIIVLLVALFVILHLADNTIGGPMEGHMPIVIPTADPSMPQP